MADNKIKLSLEEEMRNVGQALRRVTAAAFAGSPGVAGTIKGKRKTAQFTFKIGAANDRNKLRNEGQRKALSIIFSKRAAEVERNIKIALESVIAGLVGVGNANVRIAGRSLGIAKPSRSLDQEGFVKFVKSKPGAGEIGLPDPEESIRNLKAALLQAITVDVVVRANGPQIKFNFDQSRLLKLTPHPHRFEDGVQGPFFSWLSLVTGPDFASRGTPGYSLVRASDIRSSLNRLSSRSTTRVDRRRANMVEGLIRSSRTHGNAGEFAAIMMRNKSLRGGRSPSEVFGGPTSDYKPSTRFKGFWDDWWMQRKLELRVWSRRIIVALIKILLRKG